MQRINILRIILGGLLAGLVLNIGESILHSVILAEQWRMVMESLNRETIEGRSVLWIVVLSFCAGIAIVWLYAAIRPRFGPGPKTALIAGFAVWFFAWFYDYGLILIKGLYPTNLVLKAALWGLIEVPIASLAGSWFYKE